VTSFWQREITSKRRSRLRKWLRRLLEGEERSLGPWGTFKLVSKLREETGGEDLSRLWHVVNSLHINFYEAWTMLEPVKDAVGDVKRFAKKLKSSI